MDQCMSVIVILLCVFQYACTFELVPCVEDSHVRRNGVESTAAYDVHTFVSCLAVVVQLHALQKLHTATETYTLDTHTV